MNSTEMPAGSQPSQSPSGQGSAAAAAQGHPQRTLTWAPVMVAEPRRPQPPRLSSQILGADQDQDQDQDQAPASPSVLEAAHSLNELREVTEAAWSLVGLRSARYQDEEEESRVSMMMRDRSSTIPLSPSPERPPRLMLRLRNPTRELSPEEESLLWVANHEGRLSFSMLEFWRDWQRHPNDGHCRKVFWRCAEVLLPELRRDKELRRAAREWREGTYQVRKPKGKGKGKGKVRNEDKDEEESKVQTGTRTTPTTRRTRAAPKSKNLPAQNTADTTRRGKVAATSQKKDCTVKSTSGKKRQTKGEATVEDKPQEPGNKRRKTGTR